jgi:hypothetical protein
MNEARPFASLSSGLLARKGAAKPAMRPQAYTNFDDLGWNDMGEGPEPTAPAPEHVPSSIAALTPAPRPVREEPSVVVQQRAIFESFDGEDEPEAAEAVEAPAPAARAEVVTLPTLRIGAAGRKAAFTLRLDSDRHLRLRLACAVIGRSAQQLVTGALDELLATIPEIEALAERVPQKTGAAGAKRN